MQLLLAQRRMRPSPRSIATLLLSSVILPLFGQTTQQPKLPSDTPDQAPGISTTVNEVSLDLVVRDKRHNAVSDLKPEDLVVTDNGVPVKLTGFHLVGADAAESRGHVITLLFDPFHGAIAKNAHNIAEKILAVLPTTGYSFAVLDYESRLRLLQGFTQDRQAIDQAVNQVTESRPIVATSNMTLSANIMDDSVPEANKAKAASLAEKNLIATAQTGIDAAGRHVDAKERALAQTLLTALNDAQAVAQGQQARLAFAGLLALVKSQQSLGDRKALIYFTANRQLTPASKKLLATISAAAAESDVSIYTVDLDAMGNAVQSDNARALSGALSAVPIPTQESAQPIQGPVIIGSNGYPAGNNWGPQQDIQVMTDFMRNGVEDLTNPFADTKSPMADFSKATGGAYIDALIGIKKPLQEMAQNLSTYYEASYVPPFTEYDGKFRTIAVKPLRAGLKITTRTGYLAVAPGEDSSIKPFEAPLLKALAEPELPTGLGFHAALLRFGDLPDGNASAVAVEVPLAELAEKSDAQTRLSSAHVSIVAQIKDASGVIVEHFSQEIVRRGVKEALDRDPAAAISYDRHFLTAPGKYTMEIAVLDENSGKTSVERREVEIPDLAAALSLSDMVPVRRMEGSHEEEDDPLQPLRYEHQKITPNLAADFPARDKDVSLFFYLHPDPASNEPMTLEMDLIHNGKPGKRISLLHSEGEHGAVPYLASVKSHSLAPGTYEIKAYLGQGGKTAEQSQTFRVEGTPQTEAASGGSKWSDDIAIGTDEGNLPVETTPPHAPGQLAIGALAMPAPALSPADAHQLIEAARERALSYNESLPNFVCTEETRRSIDFNSDGKWRLRDTIVELLSYREHAETRTTLEINGSSSDISRKAMKGALSAGEFGGVLQSVFRDESKANFQWKETDALGSDSVQVYSYRVDPANSIFSVAAPDGKPLIVGFHGEVFIESGTRRVRRISMTADGLPADLPTQAISITVDYGYVPINGLRYLMPVSAELHLKQAPHESAINTMEFRDYRREAAQ